MILIQICVCEPPNYASLCRLCFVMFCDAFFEKTVMGFNAKRMKGVFKKFLQFEMDHGDQAGVDAVKAKATEYVASLSG